MGDFVNLVENCCLFSFSPRPSDTAFGDFIVARHSTSELDSALTSASVSPYNRG